MSEHLNRSKFCYSQTRPVDSFWWGLVWSAFSMSAQCSVWFMFGPGTCTVRSGEVRGAHQMRTRHHAGCWPAGGLSCPALIKYRVVKWSHLLLDLDASGGSTACIYVALWVSSQARDGTYLLGRYLGI